VKKQKCKASIIVTTDGTYSYRRQYQLRIFGSLNERSVRFLLFAASPLSACQAGRYEATGRGVEEQSTLLLKL